MLKIPDEINEPIEMYVNHHASEITAAVLLNHRLYTPNQIEVFLEVLARLRYVLRTTKIVYRGRVPGTHAAYKYQMEHRTREEVHDWPDKFNMHPQALREVNPIHVAEMVRIVLDRLKSIGIDATNPNVAPAEASLAVPKEAHVRSQRQN